MNPVLATMAVKGVKGVKHQLQRTVGVVSTLFIIASIGWFVYVGMIKPHVNPTETVQQNADEIQNNYITESDDSFFIGMKLLGFKVGISRPVKAKQPVIKQEVENGD